MPDDHEPRTLDDAVEALSSLIRHHEALDHGGEPCMTERMNMLAWVAHRIGWTPRKGIMGTTDLIELEDRIAAYKKQHDEDHHG
jgi:hypothetical protein